LAPHETQRRVVSGKTGHHDLRRSSETVFCVPIDPDGEMVTPFGPPSFSHLRFRLAIKQQLGRKLGPRKIGRPKETAIETEDLLESRL
jgi:hypothetical protein